MERLTEVDWKERFDLKELHPKYKKLAEYEDLQEKCIELTGCGLEMLAMKYSEFIDDIARLHAFDSIALTPEEATDLKARLKYQTALTEFWEGNVQSSRDLVHTYRELMLKAREELAEYKKSCEFWHREAVKANAELGEMKIAEEQGLLKRFPYKPGDLVWFISDIYKANPKYITEVGCDNWDGEWYVKVGLFGKFSFSEIGKTVFLTREAAEEALKGGGGE